jgi:hypothetical protein
MLLFVIPHLWSIIGDSGFVVSSILPSGVALLSFHMPTGKLGSRPVNTPQIDRYQETEAILQPFVTGLNCVYR